MTNIQQKLADRLIDIAGDIMRSDGFPVGNALNVVYEDDMVIRVETAESFEKLPERKLEFYDIGDLSAELRRRGWRLIPETFVGALVNGLTNSFWPRVSGE